MEYCEFLKSKVKLVPMNGFYCHKNNINPMLYIPRDRTMMPYYLKQYSREIKLNHYFNGLTQKVDNILKK